MSPLRSIFILGTLCVFLVACTNAGASVLKPPSTASQSRQQRKKVPRKRPSPRSPWERVSVTKADKNGGVAGTYVGAGSQVRFMIAEDIDVEQRSAVFTATDGAPLARIATDDVAGTAVFEVAGVRWSTGTRLTSEQEATLRRFATTEAARAILETAAYLYWKAPGQDFTAHRITVIQLYEAIAPFYPATQKTLKQPTGTSLGKCFLDGFCQLKSNDALFGCVLEDGTSTHVTILIDGLPTECQVKELIP